MKIRPLGAQFFHVDGKTVKQTDRQTDRQADVKEPIVAYRNFAKHLKEKIFYDLTVSS